MNKTRHEDPVMAVVRRYVERSGLTYQEIGERMGFGPVSARQQVSQFLRSGDPRISSLRRFAKAMGIRVQTLLKEEKK